MTKAKRYLFRRQSVTIEYAREKSSLWSQDEVYWKPITGELMMHLTADELREVADLIGMGDDANQD